MVCRACLKISKNGLNIFEHQKDDKCVVDMIMDCTSVIMEKDDRYPVNICNNCMERLSSAYNFREMVVRSNIKLVNFYNRKVINKEEGSQNNNVDDDEVKNEIFVKNEQVDPVTTDDLLSKAILIMDNRQASLNLLMGKDMSSGVANFCCKNEDTSQTQALVKEELFVEKLPEYSSLDEIDGLFDESNSNSSSSDESSETECKNEEVKDENKTKSTSSIVREGKSRKKCINMRNHNEKQAEMLDNPDYHRIINSGLSKKEKDRETVHCRECNKTFSFRYYVAVHAYTHTGNVPFKCQQCDKCYPKESLLRKHIRSHFQTRDFACDECGKAFFRKQQLQYHKASKHSEERPYRCNVCDKAFKVPSALWKHTLIHVNDKKYVCEICGKGFVEMVGLTKHKITHTTEKNFVCTTCGKAFMRKRTLGWHLKKHLEDKPYICSYCGKRFHCTTILKNHILIHTGAKPFACEICGKTFRQRSCIGRHMRIHTGETPYPCKICSSSFKYSHHLLNHMKVHEKELLQRPEIEIKAVDE
ncbi:hypothetical protein Trydic_g23435 [Trypoxylus dichotomus]